jgi:hypothetical protein
MIKKIVYWFRYLKLCRVYYGIEWPEESPYVSQQQLINIKKGLPADDE